MMVERCIKHGKCVTTREFFKVCINRAMFDYECYKCGKVISKGDYYIVEYAYGVARRYHLNCYDNPHVRLIQSGTRGAELCRVD